MAELQMPLPQSCMQPLSYASCSLVHFDSVSLMVPKGFKITHTLMHFRLAEIFAGQKAQTPKAKMECMTKKEEKKWARKIIHIFCCVLRYICLDLLIPGFLLIFGPYDYPPRLFRKFSWMNFCLDFH